MAKYTSPTRRLNMAAPNTRANTAGITGMATKVQAKLLNGSQHSGSEVNWFQYMTSGIPGVDWSAVACGVEASRFRNLAKQYTHTPTKIGTAAGRARCGTTD